MNPKKMLLLLATTSFYSMHALALLKPEQIHISENKKSQFYIKDGLFAGGDRSLKEILIRDIRRAINPTFERWVIDVEGTKNGEPLAIARPPYYQIAVNGDEKRIILTFWGNPQMVFDTKKVSRLVKGSRAIKSIELLPKLEDDTWTFVMNLNKAHSVEVFELSHPVRMIIDIQTGKIAETKDKKASSEVISEDEDLPND